MAAPQNRKSFSPSTSQGPNLLQLSCVGVRKQNLKASFCTSCHCVTDSQRAAFPEFLTSFPSLVCLPPHQILAMPDLTQEMEDPPLQQVDFFLYLPELSFQSRCSFPFQAPGAFCVSGCWREHRKSPVWQPQLQSQRGQAAGTALRIHGSTSSFHRSCWKHPLEGAAHPRTAEFTFNGSALAQGGSWAGRAPPPAGHETTTSQEQRNQICVHFQAKLPPSGGRRKKTI